MVTGGLSISEGVEYYRIDGTEEMEPFLMTVVSESDLWMFISSSGALTAGRRDADHALFPYETDDRLHRAAGLAGPVTIIARTVDGVRLCWQPFGRERTAGCTRSIAKSVLGDRLVFEERHEQWQLVFRATWAPSSIHGWVRTVELIDDGARPVELPVELPVQVEVEVEVLDGFLDVMPAGVDALTEQIRSNLVDAYKRSEVGPLGTMAVYSLESLITDRAEPAESLTATVVWSAGFDGATIDLDNRAVRAMIDGLPRRQAQLVTGRPGAYLLRGPVTVPSSGSATWMLVADTGLTRASTVAASRTAADQHALDAVADDIAAGSDRLRALLDGADAFQSTGDPIADAHHLSNVLFNSMRGGVFPFGHHVPIDDFLDFLGRRNAPVRDRHPSIGGLGPSIDVGDLRAAAAATGDPDLLRLVLEYLPLTFSRRHGDPSRPWNRFSINVRNDDGEQLLSYEGNWRDIFQNWEALLHSYPAYFAHVVAKFVNASTIDGFNPYRISRTGIDWEVPDPDDPWSHIGYWGDHQIIYLLRLLEAWQEFEPGAINGWFAEPLFVYADVPYSIADHDAMVADPRNTITYDGERAEAIAERVERIGSDGRLLVDREGSFVRVGMFEKLLVPALGKLSSYVPDGGIWLNTQRPEWNDANNALAGPGLSMVTLFHLHRYLRFIAGLLDRAGSNDVPMSDVPMSSSVATWLGDLVAIVETLPSPAAPMDDHQRRAAVDALGAAGSAHRGRVAAAETFDIVSVDRGLVRRLCDCFGEQLAQSIAASRRADGLHHSYNRISFPDANTARVDHLGPMLEGQVAVLSSGVLEPEAAIDVIDALYASGIHRPDLDTFMLYPKVDLPSFLDRNRLSDGDADRVGRLGQGLDGPLGKIFVASGDGRLGFRADISNSNVLTDHLARVGVPESEREVIAEIYETVFDHRSFTGRSGSMYGYEGIGSIYWHMVAKLLLAAQETYWTARDRGAADDTVDRLAAAYRRLRAGLGFCKDPATFGAIPTDCYSHTPAHAGAQQPGMTGQVKEEILTRLGELGVRVVGGRVTLSPGLIRPEDVLTIASDGGPGPARLSVWAVPMTISLGSADTVTLVAGDGSRSESGGHELTRSQSNVLFMRNGAISAVDWTVGPDTFARWSRSGSSAS